MQVEVISTEELGDRSYVVHDGTTAVVIDPQRDVERVVDLLNSLALTCGLVAETHVHNDYVTGGYQLARQLGVPYVMNAEDEVQFDRHGVQDGDTLQVGLMTVHVVATPGHTVTHLAYVISDGSGPPAVFSGGSLLYGSVGRTDLIDLTRTEELTHAQYHSAHRLAAAVPDDSPLFPTHGFGSFCSSGSSTGGTDSTIGVERGRNDAFVAPDEDSFVSQLIAGLTAYPAYYAHMGAINAAGPAPVDLSLPEAVDPAALRRRIERGEWVVDLRDRTAYAHHHLDGTVGISLGAQFSTYLGWLLPWESDLTLIGETVEEVAQAQRQLVRIGIDQLSGASIGTTDHFAGANDASSYRVVTFNDSAFASSSSSRWSAQDSGEVILDVRRDDERNRGHIPGSVHIPLHSLLDRIDDVPPGRLWIHCASGFRASIAASLLARADRDVVLINDDYSSAIDTGLAAS